MVKNKNSCGFFGEEEEARASQQQRKLFFPKFGELFEKGFFWNVTLQNYVTLSHYIEKIDIACVETHVTIDFGWCQRRLDGAKKPKKNQFEQIADPVENLVKSKKH